MNIKVHKTFLKELSVIPAKERITIEKFLFDETVHMENPFSIPNIKKLKGYKNYYRIRFGNYCAGIRIEEDNVIFKRILHRKDIYRYFS